MACRPNNSKCYSASNYLENLNLDQSYRSMKIEKSRRVVESRPVCLDLETGSVWLGQTEITFTNISYRVKIIIR
jgi:hypothetical protein